MRFIFIYLMISSSFSYAIGPDNNRFTFSSFPAGCSTNNLPSGSYLQSCSNCCVVSDDAGANLYCQCRKIAVALPNLQILPGSQQAEASMIDQILNKITNNTGYDISCCTSLSNDSGQLSCDNSSADDNGMCD